MNAEIMAPSQASSESPKIRNIAAETRVDAEIMESIKASFPELMRESELIFSPTDFTKRPRMIFTRTAAATIINEATE